MKEAVARNWRMFNEPLEGLVPFMYQDVKGLVTIGMGNLIDPISTALGLQFTKRRKPGVSKPGERATRAEIEAEWKLIKSKPELAIKGHRACDPLCSLELLPAEIDKLIRVKLQQNEAFLKRQKPFRDFDNWPADAQMSLLSMAWAMGPAFATGWPRFSAACEGTDFNAAAQNCRMSEKGNAGVIKRNDANQSLFRNANAVLRGENDGFYSRENLYYPTVLLAPITITG